MKFPHSLWQNRGSLYLVAMLQFLKRDHITKLIAVHLGCHTTLFLSISIFFQKQNKQSWFHYRLLTLRHKQAMNVYIRLRSLASYIRRGPLICHKSGKNVEGFLAKVQPTRSTRPRSTAMIMSSSVCKYVRRLDPWIHFRWSLNGLFATLVGLARLECV